MARSVPNAREAFDEHGAVKDERAAGVLDLTCKSLVDHCKRHGIAG